ncbi:hypothetical protein BGW80DRAFT_62986 [Lactifluus volemus]|nr:hypothetical protein BGW80DRAFT_62986 [Lactifluus volemus]
MHLTLMRLSLESVCSRLQMSSELCCYYASGSSCRCCIQFCRRRARPHARTRVRGFILHLPQVWASATRRENVAPAPILTHGRGSTQRSVRHPSGAGETSGPASPTGTSNACHTRQNSATSHLLPCRLRRAQRSRLRSVSSHLLLPGHDARHNRCCQAFTRSC